MISIAELRRRASPAGFAEQFGCTADARVPVASAGHRGE
jgi:hypothetical protein